MMQGLGCRRALGGAAAGSPGGGTNHGNVNHILTKTSSQAKPQFAWGDKTGDKAGNKGAKGAAVGSAKLICVAEGEEFASRAAAALEVIAASFEALKPVNDDLEVKFQAAHQVVASLSNQEAFFTVTIDTEDAKIAFVSPVSALQFYVFDLNSKRWVHAEDGHSLDGLLTRDVMRHAFGTPNFAL